MEELCERFTAYGGNYQDIMVRFMGSEAMYLKFLNMLPQDDSMDRLEAALAAGDLAAAFEAAHTLKGVAGNLGLTPLHRAVCAIVEPLRTGEQIDYRPMCMAVREEFQRAESLLDGLNEGS